MFWYQVGYAIGQDLILVQRLAIRIPDSLKDLDYYGNEIRILPKIAGVIGISPSHYLSKGAYYF